MYAVSSHEHVVNRWRCVSLVEKAHLRVVKLAYQPLAHNSNTHNFGSTSMCAIVPHTPDRYLSKTTICYDITASRAGREVELL